MRHVFLPVEHSEADLVLAGQVAETLESGSLYVTWSRHGYELPQLEAAVRVLDAPGAAMVPAAPRTPGLFAEVLGTMAAILTGLVAARAHRVASGRVSAA